ncbi:uncharacterized protein LOC114519560 [Dendronephthya gigantea]|uniref:uncharacterized protein LOC114519560 n=1 Tax=Dendronephthya gigantea TaxID=151771 RepID=UPI001068F6C9|nr:uncharacterized protein LOC114519560 [Dendronephthya gigantea]
MAVNETQVTLKDNQLDDFSTNAIVKSLSMKNRRAAGNWKQLVKAIDVQKTEKSAELNHDRNKLLGKRQQIQTRTVSLANMKSLLNSQEEKPAFLKVYDSLMASMGKEKRIKSSNLRDGITKQTQSSERKKVVRKNVSLSLNELPKLGPKTNDLRCKELEKMDTDDTSCGEANSDKIIPVERRTRPQSAFDFTEEEQDMNRKLYCSPPSLPRIHLQKSHRPRFRSFEKDDADYKRKISCNDESWTNMHQCRHLRLRKRSHTMHDFKYNTRKTAGNTTR